MMKKQQGMLKTKCSVGGGGYCCDTECCMPNRWLELLCLLLTLGSFFLPGFSSDTYATNAPGTLGVCNIENPTVGQTSNKKCTTASQYNRVYFGWAPETDTGVAKNNNGSKNDISEVSDPYGSMKNNPIYWRVLNIKANDGARLTNEGATPALFMLTEYGLNKISWDVRYYDNPKDVNKQQWEFMDGSTKKTDSSLRIFLQGSSCNAKLSHDLLSSYVDSDGRYNKGVYDKCFESAEREAMLATENKEIPQKYGDGTTPSDENDQMHWYTTTKVAYGCGLSGDKLFLLSAKEVTNPEYGFSSACTSIDYTDTNKLCKQCNARGSDSGWWLRSAYSNDSYSVARVFSSGYSHGTGSYGTLVAVRFALNLPLSSVLFASDASDVGASPSTSPSPASTFTTIDPSPLTRTVHTQLTVSPTPAGAKLTIVDKTTNSPRKNFKIENVKEVEDKSIVYAVPNEVLKLEYSGAASQANASTGETEYISAIIKDSEGEGLYHSRLRAVGTDTSGTVEMTMPDLELGDDYTLIVYNEIERGAYKTNFAQCHVLELHIVEPPDEDIPDTSGTLGICNIKNPVYAAAGSTYNCVYFGQMPTSAEDNGTLKTNTGTESGIYSGTTNKKQPIYWRVLNTTANDKYATPALFMLTEYSILKPMAWDNALNNNTWSNQWTKDADETDNGATTDSAIKILLQGVSEENVYNGDVYYDENEDVKTPRSIYEDCFEAIEQSAILKTTKADDTDQSWETNGTANACNLNKEKLFLLSADEVLKTDYGFANNNSNDVNRQLSTPWWLRSAVSSNVAILRTNGEAASVLSNVPGIAVRFALNIPLSSVLFAQDANSPASTPSSTFTTIETSSLDHTRSTDPSLGYGAKLTIVDKSDTSPRHNFWIPQGKYKVARASASPTNITIPYRHAATGSGEYISAIIKESNDATSYYARLKSLSNPVDANGTVTMTIPAELQNGSYKLILMSEKDNGPYRTNYAKNYNLRLYVDENNVTITGDGAAGVCTIENPKYKEDGSVYNRVYFGKTPSLEDDTNDIQLFHRGCPKNTDGQTYILHDNPIYWRVLNTTANDKSGTPALFMLTEYCITNNMSWDNNPKKDSSAGIYESYSQRWSKEADINDNGATTDCSIKIFLNGQAGGMYNGTQIGTNYNDNANTNGAVYTTEKSEHCAYNDCFDEKERNIIMSTYNGETTNYTKENLTKDDLEWHTYNGNIRYAYGCGLNGEKLFLLSANEVIKEEYGFNPTKNTPGVEDSYYAAETNRCTRQYNSSKCNSYWWLRSAYSSNKARISYVSPLGNSSSEGSGAGNTTYSTVRFALNIPLSSILFTQDAISTASTPSPIFTPVNQITLSRTTIDYPTASNTPAEISDTIASAPTGVDTTAYIANTDGSMSTSTATLSYGAGAKLTIVDNSSEFAVTQDIALATAGSSINVDYTNASVGADEYISAIIKDTSGNALYHTRLKAVGNNSNGTVSMNIPNDITPGEYMLVIYNEHESGSYNTNYAGYDTLILIVWDASDVNYPDEQKPIITNVYKNYAGTSFKFTASDNLGLYQMTNSGGAKLRDLSGTKTTTNMSCGTQSSIMVEDLAGNTSAPQNIITDTTPPKVTISYSGGTYTLTVSDNESGVWEITNRDGTVVYRDYSC